MAQFSGQWPAGSLQNMHSSNPQVLSWNELSELIDMDVKAIIGSSQLGYESTQGSTSVREAITQQYHQQINTDQVLLTSGAQEGIFMAMHALLEADDHVLAFTPCFEPLVKVAVDIGAAVTTLPLDAANGWAINWQQLENSIQKNTKAVVINFPHNPTGSHITEQELNQLVDICDHHGCWLFSDEVFRGLEHDNNHRLPAASDLYHRAISMGVMSKALALPGIRLGWLTCQNQSFIQQAMVVKSHLSICQSSLDAALCEHIIPHSEAIWQRNQSIITHNKQTVNDLLTDSAHCFWHQPAASATAFIQLKNRTGIEFAKYLATEHQIMVMPNEAFLTPVEGFRLTLGAKYSTLNLQAVMKS